MKRLSDINESLWGDSIRRSRGDEVRKEDELDADKIGFIKSHYVYMYAHRLAYYNENDIVNPDLNDFCKFTRDYFTKGEKQIDEVISHIKRNWKREDNYFELIKNMVNSIRSDVAKTGFKKNQGESIHDTLYNWWNTIEDYGDKADILISYDVDFSENCDAEAIDAAWDDLTWNKSLKIYMDYNTPMDESLWGNSVKRSRGDEIRKEDEIHWLDFGDEFDCLWADKLYNDGKKFTREEAMVICKKEGAHLPDGNTVKKLKYTNHNGIITLGGSQKNITFPAEDYMHIWYDKGCFAFVFQYGNPLTRLDQVGAENPLLLVKPKNIEKIRP